jgi:hypothetical protein
MPNSGKWKKLLGFLKKVAPAVVGVAGTAVAGPGAGGALATIARSLVGGSEDLDLDDVASKIFADPATMVEMERLAIQRERNEQDAEFEKLELEKERQEIVNLTMRAELQAEDPWSRRWRPYFGFVAATAFGLQIVGVVFIMVTGGDSDLIKEVAGMTVIWAPAMAVLGVTSWSRGVEKKARIER